MQRAEKRVASGKKVHSALDNPSSYFTSDALENRSVALGQLLDEISNSTKTLEAADNGITAITKVVASLKATVLSALQSPGAVATKAGVESASVAGLTADDLLGAGATISGQTLTVQDRSGAAKTVTFSAAAGADSVDTLDELSDWLKANDVALQASVTRSGGTGALRLETVNSAESARPADLGGTAAGPTGLFGSEASFSPPVLNEKPAAARASFVDDYTEALTQISSIAKDANFNGVNLLQGDDLTIVFNEDASSKLYVEGADLSAGGLGFSALSAPDFYDAESIQKTLDAIESVSDRLESQSAKFGAQLQIVHTRQSFTKLAVGTLEDGSDALVNADTDREATDLATLQTRQQLIVTSLSISTRSEQAVLSLFR